MNNVLVINCGSSSVKYQLLDMDRQQLLAKGLVERIGLETGRQVDGLVETFDIAPTVLDYCGAEVPSDMSAASLRPLIEGNGQGKEMILSEFTAAKGAASRTCVRTERYKYSFGGRGEPERFFDLQEDPLERHNAVADPQYRDEVARHRLLMLDRLTRTSIRGNRG